jgi:hypothetical protein
MRVVRLASIGFCFVLACPAFAQGAQRSPTHINAVQADDRSISFQLDSPFANCVHQRKVTFTQPETGTTFAATRSARDGRFSLELASVPAPTSGFRATVEQRGRCSEDTADVAFDQASLSGGPAGGGFRGVLTSTVDACEPGRTISIHEISSDPVFVGWNLTDSSGVWTLDAAGGTYEARTDAVIVGSGDAFTLCQGLVSPPWFFEEPVEGT